MSYCPNKNLQDWDDLVSRLGEYGAYYTFYKNGNEVPYLQNRGSNRFVWDVENKFNLVTWNRVGGTNTKSIKGFSRDAAQKVVDKIRSEYVGDYIIKRVAPDGKGEFGLKVEGYPLLKSDVDKYAEDYDKDKDDVIGNYEALKQYKEFKIRSEEANEHILPPDTDMSIWDDSYEQRDISKPAVGSDDVEKQKARLLKAMPKVEKVVEDYDLPGAGVLEANGKVIRYNPKYISGDTLGHEFGHLLIDLRGGLNDPFIKEMRNQLVNTIIEEDVKSLYPDLEGTEKFDKEVLARAIGLEVEQVFAEEEKMNKFAYSLLRFFRWLESKLGLTKNNAKEIARQLTSDKDITANLKGIESSDDQYSRTTDSIIDNILNTASSIKFDEASHTYVSPAGEPLVPVSTRLREMGMGIDPDDVTDIVKTAQDYGTALHNALDTYIKSGYTTMPSEVNGHTISESAQQTLKDILQLAIDGNSKVYSEVKVYDPATNTAGTIDLLVVDSLGNFHIYDFKTFNAKKGTKYYNVSWKGKATKRDTNAAQLTMYGSILTRAYGAKVVSRSIIPLLVHQKDKNITGVFKDNYTANERNVIKLRPSLAANTHYNNLAGKDDSDINSTASVEDIKAMEAADKVLDDYATIKKKAYDLIATRKRSAGLRRRSENKEELEKLLTSIGSSDVLDKKAIALFVKNSVEYIDAAFKSFQEKKKAYDKGIQDALPVRLLERWHDIMNGYSILDDVAALIVKEGFTGSLDNDKSTTAKYLASIQRAITKKDTLRDLYKTVGKDIQAKNLAKYNTRIVSEIRNNKLYEYKKMSDTERNGVTPERMADDYIAKNIVAINKQTEAMLRAEMDVASDDIGLFARWADTVMDTNDDVVAAIVKKIVVADRTARNEYLEFKAEWIKAVSEVEKLVGYNHYTDKIEKVYDFMLEDTVDDKGNKVYTNNRISRFSSEMMKEYKKLLKETEVLDGRNMWKARQEWLNENMPLDYTAYNKAFMDKVRSLVDDGSITEEERKAVFLDIPKPEKDKSPFKKLVKDEDAAEELSDWVKSNQFTFRNPVKKWADANTKWNDYVKLREANPEDPRVKLFELIENKVIKADSSLPYRARLYSELPYISKTTIERVQSGESLKDIAKDKMSKGFIKHQDDVDKGVIADETGSPISYVPTFYKRPDEDSGKYNPSEQSLDIGTLYLNYYRMATNYAHKSDLMAEAELTKAIVEDRAYTVRDSKGNIVSRILDKGRETSLTKSGSKAMIVDQLTDFYKMNLYGQLTEDEGDITVLGMTVDKAKAANMLGGYTAYNMMGLNVIQGIANVNVGEMQQFIEGVVGEYFNLKEMHKATMEYTKNLPSIMGDIGERQKTNKLNLLNEHFDVLNEFDGTEVRKNSKFAQLTMSDTLFFASHAGEHFMQTRSMVAMLNRVKAYDSNGNLLGNMYDMYTAKDGKLVLDERVDREKSNWSKEEELLYGEKMKRILARIHGEYSALGKSALQRYALGRLAIMFRKFMVPGFKKRWGKEQYNHFIGDYTSGSYRDTALFAGKLFKSLKGFQLALASEEWNKLTDREKSNIYRTLLEVGLMLTMAVLAAVFIHLKGESDDDDEKIALGNLAYVALRGRSELSFFWNPAEAMNILRSPAASMSAIENSIKLLGQLAPPYFTGFEEYRSGSWKGHYKVLKTVNSFVPGIRQYYKYQDVQDYLTLYGK